MSLVTVQKKRQWKQEFADEMGPKSLELARRAYDNAMASDKVKDQVEVLGVIHKFTFRDEESARNITPVTISISGSKRGTRLEVTTTGGPANDVSDATIITPQPEEVFVVPDMVYPTPEPTNPLSIFDFDFTPVTE